MKIKNIFLSVALIMGSCLEAVPADVGSPAKAEQVKEAKSKLAKFKKAIKCAWSGKGCTGKERAKIVAAGVGILAATLVLAKITHLGVRHLLERRRARRAAAAVTTATPGGEQAAAAVSSAPMAAPFDHGFQQSLQLGIYSRALGELTRRIGEFQIVDPGLKNDVQDIEVVISEVRQKLMKKEDVGAAVMSIGIKIRDAQFLLHQIRQAQRDAGVPLTEWEKELMAVQQRAEQEAERMIAAQQAGQDPLGLGLLEEEEEEEEQPQ